MTATTNSPRIARMKHLFNIRRETLDRIQNLENNLSSLDRIFTVAAEEKDASLCATLAQSYRQTEQSLDSERALLAAISTEIKNMHAEEN